MSNRSLIPFGLRLSDQQLVDVSEVERGKNCGCICPSCKTALISRQGNINEWCFAHVAKGGADSIENKCEFSFWVSVALMAKQIISTVKSIKLPALTLYTNLSDEVSIASEQTISFDNVEVEQKVCSILFDALIKFKNHSIAIVFSTPIRQFYLTDLDAFDDNKVGVLEISLFDANLWLLQSDSNGKYAQILRKNILENNDNKQWLYHPRKSVIERKENIKLNIHRPSPVIAEPPVPRLRKPKRSVSKKIRIPFQKNGRTIYKTMYMPSDSFEDEHDEYKASENYKCIKCGSEWNGTHVCKKCNSHFYSIINTL